MFRGWVIAVTGAAIGFGCSSKLAHVAPGAAPEPAARSSSAPKPEPAPPLPEIEPAVQSQQPTESVTKQTEVVEPVTLACQFREEAWSHEGLRVRADAPAFASVTDAPASLLLPAGNDPKEAIVIIDDGRILLRAAIDRRDVGLHLAKPTALKGIVTLAAQTSLEWVSASNDNLHAVFEGVEDALITPIPFEVDLPCADVVIQPPDYDARASITRLKNVPKHQTAQHDVELRATQKGPVVATLRRFLEVQILELRGADARIVVDRGAYLISGWVRRKDLASARGASGLGLTGRGGGGRGVASPPFRLRCPNPIDLYVEQANDRIKVGSVNAGVEFYPADGAPADPAFIPIVVSSVDWLWLHRDVRLVVEETSIRSCTKR